MKDKEIEKRFREIEKNCKRLLQGLLDLQHDISELRKGRSSK